ncbi:MAG: YciI family protein [Bryobacteraceae bacterium]
MLLLHESADAAKHFGSLSPEDMQAMIARYKDWRTGVGGTGEKLIDGTGRVMKGPSSKVVVKDGPYAESKEVIGGFFIVEARDYDHAVELCRDCPHLEFGTIEIRQVDKV